MPKMFRSKNLANRIFERQISSPAPGTSVNRARRFYEHIVPSNAIRLLKCPDVFFHKFTDDGKYLITFCKTVEGVAVYRPTWLSYSCREDHCCFPSDAYNFESFFTKLCSISLSTGREELCQDFFLYSEKNQFGIFATSNSLVKRDAPVVDAIQGIPAIDKITFHVVRMEDGESLDKRAFYNDYITLKHSVGVLLYDDLVAIVSLRYQKIHILQISDSGKLELLLTSSCQDMDIPDRYNFLADLIIWKVQFLDRHHLLIKFGSVDVVMARNRENPAFLAVYNMETTQTISFNQDSADELCTLFELFCDHFHSSSKNSFLSTHSNNIYALEQLKCNKTQARSRQRFVENMLATLPFKCQSQSPSPYFDHSLFRYDEKLISATYRLRREYTVKQIEFILRRQPNTLFKITSGAESENLKSQNLKRSSFLFHPFLPLAISVQWIFEHPPITIIHYR